MLARHLEAGQLIGGFRLEEMVHLGGMAHLWRVSRGDPGMPLLMKIPILRPGEDPATIVGFEVEQMILPRLTGIHVPRFVASGDFDQPFVVMELIAGRSLLSRVNELPLRLEEVAAIGARIATALHDLHRQHVVHLDVKPSNIVVRDSGEVVLVDFGLARHDALPDLLAEELDAPVGTGAYISPEQLHGVRGDLRSDLFALGVLMYFFATDERPFGDPATIREWRRRLYRDPIPPRRRRADFPPWLQEVILRCLEVDPNERHATAGQLAFDLQHPEQMVLTDRATRMGRDGAIAVARRWYRARRDKRARRQSSARQLAQSPIVMAAIDLSPGMEPLAEALRLAVQRILRTEPGARLACVNVMKLNRIALDELEDAHGRNRHLRRLAELKHWARPLGIASSDVTYHVLESVDPAGALVDYGRNNHVDHIVLAARGSSTLRRFLGSTSSEVVAKAPCTVTVVRPPASRENPDASADTSPRT
jgi:nucleotide-binding universal stress UspA family protein